MPMLQTLLRSLERAPARVVWVAGLTLFLPTLFVGFAVDDYFHAAMLGDMRHFGARPDWDIFHFLSGRDDDMGPVQGAMLPWWGNAEARFRFFRPLVSMTHALDHRLWGRIAWAQHAHNLLWWAALLGAVTAFFRTLLQRTGPWPAGALQIGLASLLFAVDDAHAWPVAWIANRNAVIGGTFVALFCRQWLLWRLDGTTRALGLAAVAWLAAIGSGEMALGGLAFVFAWEMGWSESTPSAKLRAMAPALVAYSLYLVAYKWGGFGSHGSSLYVDPGDEPLRFAALALRERLPMLLTGAFTPVPAEISFLLLEAPRLLSPVVGWAGAIVVLSLLLPLLREDRLSRTLFLAGSLAMIPMAATFPANRLLMVPGLFFAPVIVRLGLRAWARGRRAFAWTIAAVHGPLAALSALAMAGVIAGAARLSEERILAAEYSGDPEARITILGSADFLSATYLPMGRWFHRGELPAAVWLASLVPGDLEARRIDRHTLELWAPAPGFGATMWEGLFRDRFDQKVGDRALRGELEATVTEVERGQIRAVALRYALPLDDPKMSFLSWRDGRMARWEPPEVGACVVVPLRIEALPGIKVVMRPELGDQCLPKRRAATPAVAALVPSPTAALAPTPTTAPTLGATPLGGRCAVEWKGATSWNPAGSAPCPTAGPIPMAILGDPGRPGPQLERVATAAGARCQQIGCAAALIPGDLYYGSGEGGDAGWRAIWDERLSRVGRPTLAVFGNHEWREEPHSARKRQAVLRSHGRLGFVMPASTWLARVLRGGRPAIVVVGLDSDRIAAPGLGDHVGDPEAPDAPLRGDVDLGASWLEAACATALPVVVMLHEPISTQGGHADDRIDHIEGAPLVLPLLRAFIRERAAAGCDIRVVVAGHDHDLQAYGGGCEEPGTPPTVVSGVAGKPFRPHHTGHLDRCPGVATAASFHLRGLPEGYGGFTEIAVDPGRGATETRHFTVDEAGGIALQWEGSFPTPEPKRP